MPKAELQSGTEVPNDARIVFDVNPPIDTAVWLNTIDNSLPTSKVSPLGATNPYIVFYVNWAGSDTGSGIRDYTVFFSENGGPYVSWISDTTATSGIFAGQPGKSYSFHTIARDKAGNEENIKTTAEASTTTPNVVTNAVDDPAYFVLQHYRDFLNRDPDAAGFDFWTSQIASCGTNVVCVDQQRTNVSAAFFLSIEFQETGYLGYRARKAAFGNLSGMPVPLRRETLLFDSRQIGFGVRVNVGDWEAQLEGNKRAYFDALAGSARFTALYPQGMTAEHFVDTLNANAGGALSIPERDTLVNDLSGNIRTRAQVLRAVAEDADFVRAEFNRAFVLMQYFGYLQRNPDDLPDADFAGFDFWLTKMNQFSVAGEDVRIESVALGRIHRAEMVRAFIVAGEYRGRFGP